MILKLQQGLVEYPILNVDPIPLIISLLYASSLTGSQSHRRRGGYNLYKCCTNLPYSIQTQRNTQHNQKKKKQWLGYILLLLLPFPLFLSKLIKFSICLIKTEPNWGGKHICLKFLSALSPPISPPCSSSTIVIIFE